MISGASLLLMGVPVIHMRGVGIGFGTTRSGGFFFVWTLLALGVTALFSVILSARTVEPAMAPVPLVQQPEHGKALRTA